MDPDLQDILNRLENGDGGENAPTTDELQHVKRELARAIQAALTPDEHGRVDIATAEDLTKVRDEVKGELDRRAAEVEEQQERASKLLEGLEDDLAEDVADDTDTTDGDEAGDGEGAVEGEEPSTEQPTGDDGEAVEEPEAVEQPVPLAASLDRAGVGKAFARARRSGRRTAEPSDGTTAMSSAVRVTTAGPALSERAPRSLQDVADIFHRNANRGDRGKQTLVSIRRDYPTERSLGSDAGENTRRLDAVMSRQALVAAGGICAPLPADFSHPVIGDRGRAIRDALPQFNADRGGVRFQPSVTLADLATATRVWTHAVDQDPSDQVKPFPRVDCEPEEDVYVDAVTAGLTVGNFQARFNPEFWASRLELLMVQHDRLAEQTLFNTMVGASTAVQAPAVDSNTIQSLFISLGKAAAGLKSRHRLNTTRLRFVAPEWLRAAIVAAVVRQAGRAGGPIDDLIAVAESRIASWFQARNIDPTWSVDLQVFGAQGAGNLLDWPLSTGDATALLYPEGTFFFLDGGTLDLGTDITDSTLNTTNDRQAFFETFEQVAYRGGEALAIDIPVAEDCVCEPAGAGS